MKTALVKIGLVALLGGVLAFVSCKKEHHYNMNNQDFVTQAASGNMFEIAAGKLAVHSSNTDVQAFGNLMITDHGKTGADMASLAAKKGWTIPASMLPKDQQNLDSLSSLSGNAFAKKFAAVMVTAHMQTIDLFQKAASDEGVPDADLRSFTSSTLPTLREHLQAAQQLKDKLGNINF